MDGGDNFELVTNVTDAGNFDDIVCDLDGQQLVSQESTLIPPFFGCIEFMNITYIINFQCL
jgi:hypothetical protein